MTDQDNELKNREVAIDEVVASSSDESDVACGTARDAGPAAEPGAAAVAEVDAESGAVTATESAAEPSAKPAVDRTAEMPAFTERISPATILQADSAAVDDAADSSSATGSVASHRIVAIAAAVFVMLAVVAGLAYALGGSGQSQGADPSAAQQSSIASTESPSSASSESAAAKDAGASGNSDQATTTEKSQEDARAQGDQASSTQDGVSYSVDSAAVEEEVEPSERRADASSSDIYESIDGNSSSSNSSHSGSSAKSTITVYLGIDSSRAAEYGLSGPSASMSIELDEGATVYDALCASGFSISGSSSYVSAIGGLAEKQCGSGSGWTYAVNGSFPSRACGRYVLSGGESISWIYSTEKDPTMSM